MAALVLFAGCKKEKETTGTTLRASIEQQKTGGSRTSIDPVADNQAEIRWTTGDKIVVNNGTSSATFALVNGAGTTEGTFNYNGEYDFGDNNIAVYPETATISGSEITVTLPAEKAIAAPGVGVSPMMGTFSDPDLTFTSLCGALGISLTGDKDITAVEIVSNKNEQLNGTFACTTDSRQLNVAATTDESQKKMRLTCATTLTATPQTFYFALPVGALAEGFTLNVYGEGTDPIFSKSTSNDVSIVLNQVNQMPAMEVADAPTIPAPTGALAGVFSVSASKKVYFSKGNLQYGLSTRQWSFMEHQYDMVEYNDAYIGNNYTDGDVNSVSLFGFGTSGRPNGSANYQPYNTAYVSDNGEGDHVFLYGPLVNGRMVNPTGEYYYADWGYNAISNGGNQQNMGWRTLTLDEWNYLLGPTYNNPVTNCREGYRFVKANVCGRNGLIILPDGWGDNNYQLNAYNNMGSYSNNSIDATAWATLEEQGAVFLPAAGYRRGGTYFPFAAVGTTGSYWTSSVVGDATSRVSYVDFNNDVIATNIPLNSYYGFSVRLVFPAN